MLNPILALFLSASALASMPEVRTFPAEGLTKVIIENESGFTRINSTGKDKAVVGIERKTFPEACKLTTERAGETFTVRVSRQSITPTAKCEVDLVVRIPPKMDVSLTSGAGNSEANGPFQDFSFQVGSGEIRVKGPMTHFLGDTGSGRVQMEGLNTGGELKSGSGTIELTYGDSMLPGKLTMKTGSGSARVAFPAGAKLKVNFTSGSGKLTNKLGTDPKAGFLVSMEAGSGDLEIVKK